MALAKETKEDIITEFGRSAANTGSTEVQIALLTKRIAELTQHFKIHKKDFSSRRGLLKLVGQRRNLIKYLKRVNLESYRALIEKLGLRK